MRPMLSVGRRGPEQSSTYPAKATSISIFMRGLKSRLIYLLVAVPCVACIYERGWEYRVENAARVIDSSGKPWHSFLLNIEPGLRVEIYAHVVIMALAIKLNIQNSTDMVVTIDKRRLAILDAIATPFEKPERACEAKIGQGEWERHESVIIVPFHTEVLLDCRFASPKYPAALTFILDGFNHGARTVPAFKARLLQD